jgi:hypothetical protein
MNLKIILRVLWYNITPVVIMILITNIVIIISDILAVNIFNKRKFIHFIFYAVAAAFAALLTVDKLRALRKQNGNVILFSNTIIALLLTFLLYKILCFFSQYRYMAIMLSSPYEVLVPYSYALTVCFFIVYNIAIIGISIVIVSTPTKNTIS